MLIVWSSFKANKGISILMKLYDALPRNSLITIYKSFTQPQSIPNSIFCIFNPLGLKLITRLWLGLSHLNEHRFKHDFNNCINPLCTYSLDIIQQFTIFSTATTKNSARIFLLNNLNSSGRTLLNISDLSLVN